MIVTQQKRIPWSWVFLAALPSIASSCVMACSGSILAFTMRRFIEIPALITLLSSVNIIFNVVIAPMVAYWSDHIWTRFGRRKPFIIFGWLGLIATLIFVPLAPNIWVLCVVVVAYNFFEDLAYTGPFTPLFFEIVPGPQRGRAKALVDYFNLMVRVYFQFFLLKHFDHMLDFHFFAIKGEHFIYWMSAAVVLVMIFHVTFNIKETPPLEAIPKEKHSFSLIKFVKETLGQRQWRLIYLLCFSQIAMTQGLGPLESFLVTEQFGYSKGFLGQLNGTSLLIRAVLVVPLAGFIADKFNRLRIFQVCLAGSAFFPISYWAFIKYLAATNHVPSFGAMIGFMFYNSVFDIIGVVALAALFFDYIPRAKMGTIFGGLTFVLGFVRLFIYNGVGVFVTGHQKLFSLPHSDYSSAYLFLFVVGLCGCVATAYFAKQVRLGNVVAYGRLDLEAGEESPQETDEAAQIKS